MIFGNSITCARDKNRVRSIIIGSVGGKRYCLYGRSCTSKGRGRSLQAITKRIIQTIFMSSAVSVCINCACLEVTFSVQSQLFAAAKSCELEGSAKHMCEYATAVPTLSAMYQVHITVAIAPKGHARATSNAYVLRKTYPDIHFLAKASATLTLRLPRPTAGVRDLLR